MCVAVPIPCHTHTNTHSHTYSYTHIQKAIYKEIVKVLLVVTTASDSHSYVRKF